MDQRALQFRVSLIASRLYQIQSIRGEKMNSMISTLHERSADNGDNQLKEVSPSMSSNHAKKNSPVPEVAFIPHYQGILGTVTLQRKKRYINSRAVQRLVTIDESAWIIRPSFISYVLELRYIQSFRHISRTLNIYPVLYDTDEVFRMCSKGDVHGLQDLLSQGIVSPFVSDQDGWTLLHVSALTPL